MDNTQCTADSSAVKETVIIIIKKISRAPIYCTRCEHRALYNNTNNTHTHTHTHTHMNSCMHTHTRRSDEGIGTAVKNSVEIVIKQYTHEVLEP